MTVLDPKVAPKWLKPCFMPKVDASDTNARWFVRESGLLNYFVQKG